MARAIDKQLAALRALDPASSTAPPLLRAALATPSGVVVEAAARVVAAHGVPGLVDALADAFEALCVDPVKRDPGARGKLAIALALGALDAWEPRVFEVGVRLAQPQGMVSPVTGRQDDAAAPLRAECGLAHVRMLRDDALDVLARLLGDPERTPRIAAAQGLGALGRPDASALVRFKLALGDDEHEVLGALCEALLHLAPRAAPAFLIELLGKHDLRAEIAALALGGARIAEALEPLTIWASGCRPGERHRVGYLAIALLRSDAATAYLGEAIAIRPPAEAVAAARALATFVVDPAVAAVIRAAAEARKDAQTRAAVLALLG